MMMKCIVERGNSTRRDPRPSSKQICYAHPLATSSAEITTSSKMQTFKRWLK